MTRIEQCLAAESRERVAAAKASNAVARDLHIMLAERYADEAWSLNEEDETLPHYESGLWKVGPMKRAGSLQIQTYGH